MVLPAGITKDSGLTAVLTEMNLSAHNTIAVGDAENDLSLFAVAEIGVAVVEPSRRFANTPISCSTPLPDIRAPSIVKPAFPVARYVGSVIPFLTLLMNPLATCPVTSMRCSRLTSDPPNSPRSRSVQSVIRWARTRKPTAVLIHRR